MPFNRYSVFNTYAQATDPQQVSVQEFAADGPVVGASGTWQDRVQEAAYNSPTGTRIPLIYEQVNAAFELRGTRFDFINVPGTYVQATGPSGQEFALRVYFNGSDHDLRAAAFFDALREPGIGILEHPIRGRVDVVPLGRVMQRNDLVDAANESVFDVTFWETTGTLYPLRQTDPASDVLSKVSGYDNAAATAFANNVVVESGSELAQLSNKIRNITATADKYLRPIADTVESVSNQFNDIRDSITNVVDTLIGQPLTLAFQISELIEAPGRATALWLDKLNAYGNLAQSIFSQGTEQPTTDRTAQNLFYADDLAASSALTGMIVGAVNNEFTTQPEAIEAAQEILMLSEALTQWREANYQALNETDTGEAYQQWQDAAALAAGYLVEISFSLAQERIITTDRARTIVDLAAQLYGSVDDRLDFLINSNSLSGDEIIEVPKGRKIKYYV